jgi:tetraacyldisaccharide 4'-kinase
MERHLNALWYSPNRQPPWLYRRLAGLHRRLARSRAHRPPGRPRVPVLVVGNLCAGGSGKTPVVIALARALKGDRRVVVISRGYGGRAEGYPLTVEAETPVSACGDEALLIRRAAEVPVIVDPQRSRALREAIEGAGADLVLSDDGLQHQALPRSFEVCLFDGGRGIGNGYLLPAGPLRQPLERLAEVDEVLIKGPGYDWPGADRFQLRPLALRPLADWRSGARAVDAADRPAENPLAWRGRAVGAVCALANPEQFKATLEGLGLTVDLRAFPDHHRYRPADLKGLEGPVLTSAKDAVKLPPWADPFDVFVLDVAAELPPAFLRRVRDHVRGFVA